MYNLPFRGRGAQNDIPNGFLYHAPHFLHSILHDCEQFISYNLCCDPFFLLVTIIREISNVAVIISVMSQTTITESTEQVNMKILKKQHPEKTSGKGKS
jgi:hypothetical protein